MSDFELVQVHEANGHAEVVVRDRNGCKVYAGNLDLADNPKSYYPPSDGCEHSWIVYSTSLADIMIMVECARCKQCGKIGQYDFTDQDWNEAFHAPSDTYPLRSGLYPFVRMD